MELDVLILELFIEEIDKLGQIVFKNKGEDVVRYNCDRYNNKLKNGYRDWETDRKSTRLNSSHSAKSRMPSSA